MILDAVKEATNRRFAVDLLNRSWQLLELESRSPAQDDELIHVAHAALPLGEVNLTAGSRAEAEHHRALAQSELANITDPEDREIIASQIAELDL